MSTSEPTPPQRDEAEAATPAVPSPDEQMGGAPPEQPSGAAPEQPAGAPPEQPAGSPLAEAEATEAALRAQLGELVSARVRAETEAARLADRATLAGADPSLLDLSARYRDQAGRLVGEIEGLRGQLRAHEARTEALRADAQGV